MEERLNALLFDISHLKSPFFAAFYRYYKIVSWQPKNLPNKLQTYCNCIEIDIISNDCSII